MFGGIFELMAILRGPCFLQLRGRCLAVETDRFSSVFPDRVAFSFFYGRQQENPFPRSEVRAAGGVGGEHAGRPPACGLLVGV